MFFPVDPTKFFDLFIYDPYDPLLFSSALFPFLFFFILIIYRITSPVKVLRVSVLVIFSLFFYYKSNGIFFLLLIFTAVLNYYSAIWIGKSEGTGRRIIFLCAVIADLALLGYFKYTDFFISFINNFRSEGFDLLDIFMPVGISFEVVGKDNPAAR